MRKFLILPFLFVGIFSFAQKKSNPLVGKKEIETSFLSLVDEHLFFGGQVTCRVPLKKSFKVGAGVLYGVDYDDNTYLVDAFGYGGIFADIIKFLGARQKWSFNGQIGHGVYKRSWGSGSIPLVAGIYYSISPSYRAIISKRTLFTTALLIGYRNFHYKKSEFTYFYNFGFVGIKAGIVF